MNNKMNIPLSGIIPPLVTPLLGDDVLDVEGLQRSIEHLTVGGVHTLFVLGTTGESQSLSYRLRIGMTKDTCRIAEGRLLILVCISDTSIVESVNLACLAADYGADAVVSAPPYYFATGQPELIEFYEHLLPQLPLPLSLYNMPTHTKVSFASATIQWIAENPGIIGFKDSSANAVYFQSVMCAMKDSPDFSMLVGPEEIMAESVLLEAHGGVNGGADMFPELYVSLYNAAKDADMEEVRRLQEGVVQIGATIYTIGQHGSSYLKDLKCALGLLGICSDCMAAPFHEFEQRERGKIREALQNLGVDVVLR